MATLRLESRRLLPFAVCVLVAGLVWAAGAPLWVSYGVGLASAAIVAWYRSVTWLQRRSAAFASAAFAASAVPSFRASAAGQNGQTASVYLEGGSAVAVVTFTAAAFLFARLDAAQRQPGRSGAGHAPTAALVVQDDLPEHEEPRRATQPPVPRPATPPPHPENPYWLAGGVPSNCAAYVARPCDRELAASLKDRSLNLVYGGFRFGKSSLMARTPGLWRADCQPRFLDLTLFNTDDPQQFFREFFEVVAPGGSDRWEHLALHFQEQPTIVLLDEFNLVGPAVLDAFLPRMSYLATSCPTTFRLVAFSSRTPSAHFARRNPTHTGRWTHVRIDAPTIGQFTGLVDLLDYEIRDSVIGILATVGVATPMEPARLQRGLALVFDASRAGASKADALSHLEYELQVRR